jgi:hypothetical protein
MITRMIYLFILWNPNIQCRAHKLPDVRPKTSSPPFRPYMPIFKTQIETIFLSGMLSSGMWHPVGLVKTGVSMQHVALIRNVGSKKSHTSPNRRRRHSSQSPPWKPLILYNFSVHACTHALYIDLSSPLLPWTGFPIFHLDHTNMTSMVCDVSHLSRPVLCTRPPRWSSCQISWLLTQRSRVRFLALPDFLSSSGSGTGSTQPLWGYMRSYLK